MPVFMMILCGWGNLSEICATIGDLGECNDILKDVNGIKIESM